MIVRYNIKCNTCNSITTLRIQLIHSKYEELKFLCPHCKENLSVEMYTDYEKVTYSVKPKKNCEVSFEEGECLYIGSEIITTENMANDSMILPAPMFMHQVNESGVFDYFIKDESRKNWNILHRAFSQLQLKNFDLYDKLIQEYCTNTKIKGISTYRECLYDHITRLLADSLKKKILSIYEVFHTRGQRQVQWLRNYFKQRIKVMLPQFEIVINEMYDNFDQNYPFLIFIRSNMDDINEIYFPTSDFESIKSQYGNAFELFAELIEILACINNLMDGRDYDVFKKMTLDKYKGIDKAKRADPFKENRLLYVLCNEFDSTIRNASHHGHFEYNKRSNVIEYGADVDKFVIFDTISSKSSTDLLVSRS